MKSNIIFTYIDWFNDKLQGGSLSCDSSKVECYVIDNNGFVVISEDPLNTGKFFGEIDGTVLNSLVQHQVYKKIKIYDYQVNFSGSFDRYQCLAKVFETFLSVLFWSISLCYHPDRFHSAFRKQKA